MLARGIMPLRKSTDCKTKVKPMNDDEILALEICECGSKSVSEAIKIFQNTDLPYPKAKKFVTGCQKSCCRHALMKLFDMTYFGEFDLPEIARLIAIRDSKLSKFIEDIKG